MAIEFKLCVFKKPAEIFVFALLLIASHTANAGGFELHDESVTYLGNAYAGTCSAVQDGSTAYYNPAGMIELSSSELLFGYTFIRQDIKLYNEYGTISQGSKLTGIDPSIPNANLSIPTGHIALKLSENIALGFSVVQPFGLYTQYNASDMARIMATETKLTFVDLSPSIGIRLGPVVDIGFGLDILHSSTKFSSAVSWANIGTESNGSIAFSASKWDLGYHIGALLKVTESTKLGVTYFSSFYPKFFSKNVLSNNAVDFVGITTVSYNIKLPNRINVGITQDHKKFSFMGEFEETCWNKLQGIVFNFYGADAPGVKNLQFKNSWRVSLGADYRFNPLFTLKAGAAFDQSPTRNGYREVMMPDSDRYLLALGAKFKVHKYLAVVAGYAHTFYRSVSINEVSANDAFNLTPFVTNQAAYNANVDNHANTFGIQAVLSFG